MMPDRDEMDLADLARAAGVTPRTVRYYVQQGLLPSPGTRGPGTKWDRALLDRLQLIKLLQREHWPLSKIREHVEALDDDGVRRALGEPPELPLGGAAPESGRRVSESALSYVRGVLGRVAEPPYAEERRSKLGRVKHDSATLFEAPAAFAESEASPRAPRPGKWEVTKSTWERIRLTRDVELSVRRPLTREQNRLVDRLLEAAREIFSEEPER